MRPPQRHGQAEPPARSPHGPARAASSTAAASSRHPRSRGNLRASSGPGVDNLALRTRSARAAPAAASAGSALRLERGVAGVSPNRRKRTILSHIPKLRRRGRGKVSKCPRGPATPRPDAVRCRAMPSSALQFRICSHRVSSYRAASPPGEAGSAGSEEAGSQIARCGDVRRAAPLSRHAARRAVHHATAHSAHSHRRPGRGWAGRCRQRAWQAN